MGSLRVRAALLTMGVVVATTICLYSLLHLTLGRDIAKLNEELSAENVKRVIIALQTQESTLKALYIDYAAWDDSYQFVTDLNETYIRSNFPLDTFENNNLNLLLIYNTEAKLIYNRVTDPLCQEEIPLPPDIAEYFAHALPALEGATLSDAKVGLLNCSGRLMMIAAGPILTSMDEGPSRGTWIFGRDLAAPEIAELSQTVGATIDLSLSASIGEDRCWLELNQQPAGAHCLEELKGDKTQVCTLLIDLFGQPIGLARVYAPSRLIAANRQFEQSVLAILVAVGLLVTATALLLFSGKLLNPIVSLSRQATLIGESGDFKRRVTIHGADELSSLGTSINSMLDALQRSFSDREKAEADYRLLVELAQEGIVSVDANEVITFVNPAFCRAIGFRHSDLIGMPLFDLVDPEMRPLIEEGSAARRQGAVSAYDLRMNSRSGQAVDFLVNVCAMTDSAGHYTGALGVLTDITEHKRSERALAETQKLESLGLLAGGIAHDFNNILVGIVGNAELLSADLPPDSQSRELAENMLLAGRRAADLTRQMLAYSGRNKLEFGTVNLNNMLVELDRLLKAAIPKKVDLLFNLSSSLPNLDGDASQLRQVAMNLIINAAEAIGDASGTVKVTTGVMHADHALFNGAVLDQALPEGEYIYLEVADTGCGLDEAKLKRIFDPFFTTKFTGRGLGLSAVLGIVRAHLGTITVKSKPGQGTTFCVLIPFSEMQDVEPSQPQPSRSLQQGAGTLLVIDDEPFVRQILERMLRKSGYEVLCAEDGEQGIALLLGATQEIKLILLDLTMPKMDGVEVLRRIRQHGSESAVVLMSGFSEASAHNQTQGLNVAGFLNKPFTISDLLEVVDQALANPCVSA